MSVVAGPTPSRSLPSSVRPAAGPAVGRRAVLDTLGTVQWVEGEQVESAGVLERRFDVVHDGRRVPGLVWTPAEPSPPRPVVLISHGAASSKREGYVVSLARRLVRQHGLAAAAIDGPVHGDRRADGGASPTLSFLEFSQVWSGSETMTDEMVADWQMVLDELQRLEEITPGPAGWWGLSMGTILGLPLVAAEPRITVAVLGLMGLTGPTRDRIAADAPKVTCPVLFLAQWDDELFPRSTAIELFEALGSTDKRLHLQMGRHAEVPTEEFLFSEGFLAEHLGTGSGPQP